jgi:hypothetical protein
MYLATTTPPSSAASLSTLAASILEPSAIKKIISGGQTGADRAALDFALEHDIPHGGWCPKGRLAQEDCIDARYQLTDSKRKTSRT